MPKIDVNKVAEILKKNHIDPAVLRRVVEEMNLAVQPDPGEGTSLLPVKKQYLILLSDPEGRMPKGDFTGWVLQIPESESPASSQERLLKGTYDYNASKKGRALAREDRGRRARERPGPLLQGRRALGEDKDAGRRPAHRQRDPKA
jgi:hypothetical protein